MNIIESRELLQYGFRPWKNYDLAVKMLKAYKADEYKSLALHQDLAGELPVFACRFCRIPSYEHLLALANEDGKIGIQDTISVCKNGSRNNILCTQGHMNAIFDLAWSDSSLRIVSVSGDHTAVLWDVSSSSLSPLGMFEGHSRSVKVAAFRPRDANVFATGARDGMIIMWDYRCSQQNTSTIKPDNVISNAHCQSGSAVKRAKRKEPSRADSITGLVFQNENFLISCSAGDGIIKVWDVRKCYSMHRRVPQACYSLPYPGTSTKNGFTSLNVDPGAVRLYANCIDNNIYCYNIATYEKMPVATYSGHQNQTFYIKSCLSSDGQYLLSGSSDEKACVWSVKRPGAPLARLVGHSAEVTCVDWATNSDGDIKVVTCSDDSCHRLWRLRPPTDAELVGWTKDPELVGWTEWLDSAAGSYLHTTPRTFKHLSRRHLDTPPSTGDAKRQKTDVVEGQERTVLAALQPHSEGKGARRLFDSDSSSHCSSGVEVLSPTSNLPNYVIEGTSPFHRCSSASKQKENWLAKLQSTPSPKPLQKLTPKRRSQSQNTPKACGNLLKFFRVSAKQSPLNISNCEATLSKDLPSLLS